MLVCLVLVSTLRADDETRKMTDRLSEEAEAFQKLAGQVLGKETLHQTSQKPPGRFHPRVGTVAPAPVWMDRDIVSEYGFATFSGDPSAVHELRQVLSVDGRKIGDAKKAEDSLAKLITASDDARKKEVLKQFEKYGLVGAVTDFGQLILLFTRRDLERYEFAARGPRVAGVTPALVFSYKQLDGPEALTLIEANKKDRTHRLRVEGEIWVREKDYLPVADYAGCDSRRRGIGATRGGVRRVCDEPLRRLASKVHRAQRIARREDRRTESLHLYRFPEV